eukprot:gnl/TRDRNA2_/TRDRNA2_162745_c4_seq1.p1 gnl/TRDRNA2_/TRDRNA2_162745_c4~~gnl/TRDRNA2_/TRDRNA2_162745_c4_seq1.p1  ORF type:complete len:329 (-),score=67.25 gnl/TRDRNA2_/TRDRNA2_162745_c4_seq1:32-1018(-)
MDEATISKALKQTDELGWAVVSVGQDATAVEMEVVGKKLLRIDNSAGGTYNGGGGVSRAAIDNSAWLNAAEGAPATLRIQFHNEMAYSRTFPKYITFAMFRPADVDGTTLVVDNVKVTEHLSAKLKAKMFDLGIRYIRLLYDESEKSLPDYFLSWQDAFCTKDPDEAMTKATGADMFAEWYEGPGGTKRMKHIAWAPLFVTHPVKGELYFTSVLNRHGSWLDGHEVFGKLPLDQRPYQCEWGDGTALSDSELDELRKVQDDAMERVQLSKGDVIVVDNLRAQHGRTPFQGKRLLGLMLSDMVPREEKHVPPSCFEAATEQSAKRPRVK